MVSQFTGQNSKPPRWNGHVRRLQMARFRSKPWAGWSVVVGRVSSFTCMKLGYMVEYTTKLVRRKKEVYWGTKDCHLKIVYLVVLLVLNENWWNIEFQIFWKWLNHVKRELPENKLPKDFSSFFSLLLHSQNLLVWFVIEYANDIPTWIRVGSSIWNRELIIQSNTSFLKDFYNSFQK